MKFLASLALCFTLSSHAQSVYLSLLCTAVDYPEHFLVKFGDERTSGGELLESGVYQVVQDDRRLLDKALFESVNRPGETDRMLLTSGGSVEFYRDMAGDLWGYLRRSSALNGGSTTLENCRAISF